ncbi:MAG: putative sulfate exporter family transporter [Oligoflexia bacterium]|nr:putative sulfate exporter family transporter [Oligoflexia bacterium]
MEKSERFGLGLARWAVPLAGALCLWPQVSAGVALLLGVAVALWAGNPYSTTTKRLTHRLLTLSVMGLGAGMNLFVVAQVGLHGIGYTVLSISAAFAIGTVLGRLLGTNRDTSLLVTVGTAICGGSAIAAVAPVLRAKHHEVSVALGIVFLLNAMALFIFPPIGHALSLSESQFGLWSALAIHDTSSVVGAALQYGPHALEVGTTVKLARALWIVPVTFLVGLAVARRPEHVKGESKPKRPWFILGFLMMAAIVTWVPQVQFAGHWIEAAAKRLLVLTLFLIGTNLTRETLRSVGFKPFVQGVALWLFMGVGTLFAIVEGWIG